MSNNQSPEFDPRVVQHPCPLHEGLLKDLEHGEKRMERLDNNVVEILKRQSAQDLAIQRIELAIGNGLRGDIRRTMEGVESLSAKVTQICQNYDAKLATHEKELSDFRWFRDWANKFKDSLIKKFLTMAFVGGMIFTAVYLIEKYLR